MTWVPAGISVVSLRSPSGRSTVLVLERRALLFSGYPRPGGVHNVRHSGESRNPEGKGNGRSATDSRSKLTRQQLCTEPLRVSFAEGIERLDSRWFEVLNVASYDRQSML